MSAGTLPAQPTIAARDRALRGPLAGSVRIGFVMLYAAVLVLGAAWASGNVRQVPPDQRAVVLRFGRVNRVQQSGLLLAWPRPIEVVRLLPAADRQMEYKVPAQQSGFQSDETDMQFAPNDDVIHLQGERDLNNAAYLMTGDGNVVRLDTSLFFSISNPAAYLLAEDRVLPALQRVYLASAVALSAARSLDDFLVAQPDQPQTGKAAAETVATLAARRQALRGDLVAEINRRLETLRSEGDDLGIVVGRADVVALLPPVAKAAFDGVLTASQIAEQTAAAARTDAARTLQEAERERDRLVTEAAAAAEERVRTATADVAPIAALQSQETPANRGMLLTHAYQEQIAGILQRIGDVTGVDIRDGRSLLLPGPTNGGAR
jgi:regulator of protease activity HflC (stomatin/prohibitin superfamily)